jgi:hypothetical protein
MRVNAPKFWLPFFVMITSQGMAGWEEISPLPEPNGGFACGVAARKIFVIGGTNWKENRKQWLDGIWVFDPARHGWGVRGRLPHPLAYAVAVEWRGELIIAGGTDGSLARKEVWRLTPSAEITQIGALNMDGVYAVGGAVGADLLLLGGGPEAATFNGFHRGGERLRLNRCSPTALPPAGDVAFGLAAGAVMGRNWYIFGGVTTQPTAPAVNLAAAWVFDADKGTWRGLHPYPFAVRGVSAVKLDREQIFLAGGYGGEPEGFAAAAFVYDAWRDLYTRTKDLPTAGLVGLARADNFVYCLGGEDKDRHRTAACFRIKANELLAAAKANP